MPLFFFVSGYIINKVTKIKDVDGLFKFYYKKFISLIVPTITWSILVDKCFFNNEFPKLSLSIVINCFNGNNLWFLSTLFYFMIPVGLFKLFYKENSIYSNLSFGFFVVFWIIFVIISHFTGAMKQGCLYFPYFIIGIVVSIYPKIDSWIKSAPIFAMSLMVFCLVSGYWVSGHTSIFNLSARLITALSAICMVYNLVVRIKWNTIIDKVIRQIGVNTLGVYVAHWYFLGHIHLCDNWFFAIVELVFLSLIISYACVGIQKMLELSDVLKVLFYGKLRTK